MEKIIHTDAVNYPITHNIALGNNNCSVTTKKKEDMDAQWDAGGMWHLPY